MRTRPTGRLRLLLPNGYGGVRAKWTEGDRGPLEHKLESVFRTLERRAQEDDAAAVEQARRNDAWQREQDAREEQRRRQRIEHARSQRLLAETVAWHRVGETRAHFQALEQKLLLLAEEERGRVAAWIEWASEWARRADPVENTQLIVGFDDGQDQFASLPNPWADRR
jgi:hypothetical protein